MIRVVPWRVAGVLAYMGGLLLLSSVPGRQLVHLGLSASALNLAHVPLFAGLAWLTAAAFVGTRVSRAMLTAGVCALFAVTDEWHQSFVPGRVAALGDLLADTAGIALGIGLREGLRPAVLTWRGDPQR